MAVKRLLLLITALCFLANAYAQPSNDNYTLTIKKGKEVKERGKVFWAISVTLTNSSKDTLKYYSMSCSWQDFYYVDNNSLKIEQLHCEKNVPDVLQLPPGRNNTVILRLIKPYDPLKINFRVGLNLILFTKNKGLTSRQTLSIKNMIWSNQITMEREKE